jgi:hypothetical protein
MKAGGGHVVPSDRLKTILEFSSAAESPAAVGAAGLVGAGVAGVGVGRWLSGTVDVTTAPT